MFIQEKFVPINSNSFNCDNDVEKPIEFIKKEMSVHNQIYDHSHTIFIDSNNVVIYDSRKQESIEDQWRSYRKI